MSFWRINKSLLRRLLPSFRHRSLWSLSLNWCLSPNWLFSSIPALFIPVLVLFVRVKSHIFWDWWFLCNTKVSSSWSFWLSSRGWCSLLYALFVTLVSDDAFYRLFDFALIRAFVDPALSLFLNISFLLVEAWKSFCFRVPCLQWCSGVFLLEDVLHG